MKHARMVLSALGTLAVASLASAITITGLSPSAVKVKVGQPITFTLTATGIPAQGHAMCFFRLVPGTGDWGYLGPEIMPGGFVAGTAALHPITYAKAGTFTVTVTPRAGRETGGAQDQLLIGIEDQYMSWGVQPCQGTANATVTVWDPAAVHHPLKTHLPSGSAGLKGPSKPSGGPVETTELKPGTAVALNPQPLPPGPMHTESLQTGAGATGGNSATMRQGVPFVRSVALTPSPVHEGQPVQIAITADPGCNAVLINWGDGTTTDQSLDPHRPGGERPIQHVYRAMGAKTVKVSGEHGCLGVASAALTVTIPVVRPMGSSVQVVHP
jgi:hypothetical protein